MKRSLAARSPRELPDVRDAHDGLRELGGLELERRSARLDARLVPAPIALARSPPSEARLDGEEREDDEENSALDPEERPRANQPPEREARSGSPQKGPSGVGEENRRDDGAGGDRRDRPGPLAHDEVERRREREREESSSGIGISERRRGAGAAPDLERVLAKRLRGACRRRATDPLRGARWRR